MELNCKEKNIYELCNVERAVIGKLYKTGTCFVKLSAVDDFVGQITKEREIDSRYAVLEPKNDTNIAYLHIAISRAFPEFLRKFRTTINLQFDTFKHFNVMWHEDEEQQRYVVEQIRILNEAILMEEKQIESAKAMKQYYLSKMMV